MIYEFFEAGGPLMWPLLVCSVVSLGVTIERLLFWLRTALGQDDAAADQVVAEAAQDRRDAPETAGDYAVRVMASGLRSRDHGLAERMEIAAENEIARMRRDSRPYFSPSTGRKTASGQRR